MQSNKHICHFEFVSLIEYRKRIHIYFLDRRLDVVRIHRQQLVVNRRKISESSRQTKRRSRNSRPISPTFSSLIQREVQSNHILNRLYYEYYSKSIALR